MGVSARDGAVRRYIIVIHTIAIDNYNKASQHRGYNGASETMVDDLFNDTIAIQVTTLRLKYNYVQTHTTRFLNNTIGLH